MSLLYDMVLLIQIQNKFVLNVIAFAIDEDVFAIHGMNVNEIKIILIVLIGFLHLFFGL